MILELSKVNARTAALLDDPAAVVFDAPYLLPFINQAWDGISIKLAALGLDYQESVKEINLPAGTSDLSAFQDDGAELASLLIPVKIEWRRTDETALVYASHPVPLTENLPDVSPEAEGHSGYEWRESKVYITPSSVDTVIRIRFKALSLDFIDPVDGVIRGIGHVLAWKTAEIVCSPVVRNNSAGMMYANNQYKEALDDFEGMCVKQKQRIRYQFGRPSGRSRRGVRYIARA